MPTRLASLLLTIPLLLAAAPVPEGDPSAAPETRALRLESPEVERLQRALITLELLRGPANGTYDRASDDALLRFRREARLDPDAPVDETSLRRLEERASAATLLGELQAARRAEIARARAALLSDPATRDLVETDLAPADATRDAAACLAAPTVRCLLREAGESAKAVSDAARRDWAFSEILAVEARAGLTDRALITLRRIGDPRRILRALRDIAVAHARLGDRDAAVAAAGAIPDAATREAALATIARLAPNDAGTDLPNPPEAEPPPAAPDAPPRHRAIDLIDLALVRIERADTTGAQTLLREGADLIERVEETHRRDFPRYRLVLARLALAERTGEIADLADRITELTEPHLRAQAGARLAVLQRRLGDDGAADEFEAAAFAALDAVPSRLRRIWTAADIAMALKDDGGAYLERARAEAEAYKTPWGRARSLAKLASAYLARADAKGNDE